VTAAVLFEIAKELFAAYVRYAPTAHLVYGTFVLVPIFLIWVYVSWLVVLFGAELTASLEYWEKGKWRAAMTADSRFRAVMAVGRRLVEAQGEALTFERLRLDTGVAKGELEATLERLEKRDVVRREGPNYSLTRSPGEISLGALFEAVQGDEAR
jgi:membrane protein